VVLFQATRFCHPINFISCFSYQKDKWAKSGNFLTKWCSSFPELKCFSPPQTPSRQAWKGWEFVNRLIIVWYLVNMETFCRRRSIVFLDEILYFTLFIILLSQTMSLEKWSCLFQQAAGCSKLTYSLLQNKFQYLALSKRRRTVSQNSNERSGRWVTEEMH